MRYLIIPGIIALALVAGYGCKGDEKQKPQTQTQEQKAPANQPPAPTAPSQQTTPPSPTAPSGQPDGAKK